MGENQFRPRPNYYEAQKVKAQARRDKIEDIKAENTVVDAPFRSLNKMRVAQIQESNLTEEEMLLGNASDGIYAGVMPSPKLSDPNNRPEFDPFRKTQELAKVDTTRNRLRNTMAREKLPSKGTKEFETLARDFKSLNSMLERAQTEEVGFSDIWFEDIDFGKLTYVKQTQMLMEARMLELMYNQGNLTPEQREAQVMTEFADRFKTIEEDADTAQFVDTTGESQWELTNGDGVFWEQDNPNHSQETVSVAEAKKNLNFAIGLTADIGISFIPFAGTGVGGYIAATGEDVIIEQFTGEEEKLPGWARVLVGLPVIGGVFKIFKAPGKAVARGRAATGGVLKVLGSVTSPKEMMALSTKGANAFKAALRNVHRNGEWNEIDKIFSGIKSGAIKVADDEITIMNIIKAVGLDLKRNPGAARTALRGLGKNESPLVTLTKDAILSGDKTARALVVKTIMDVGEDLSTARAKALMDTLGVSDEGMELIIRDMRSADAGYAPKLEASLLEVRRQKEVQVQRLANLEKGRATQKANRAETAKEATEAEARAAEAPLVEQTARGDAPTPKVEDAPEGSTVRLQNGAEVRVIENTPEKVTTVTGEGKVEVKRKGLTEERVKHVANRVKELGSLDAVKALYSDTSAPVDNLARKLAEKLYGKSVKPAVKPVKQVLQEAVKLTSQKAIVAKVKHVREVAEHTEDATTFLAALVKTSKNKSFVSIAKRIMGEVGETTVVVAKKTDTAHHQRLKGSRGSATRSGKTGKTSIVVRGEGYPTVTRGDTEGVILHELVHAATTEKLTRKGATGALLKAQGDITDLRSTIFDAAEHLLATSGMKKNVFQHAFKNDREFLTSALTDPKFQDILRQIKVDGSDAFTLFVENVRKLLGLSPNDTSALTEIIRLADDLIIAGSKGK